MEMAKSTKKTTLDRFTVSTAEFSSHFQTLVFVDSGEFPEALTEALGGQYVVDLGWDAFDPDHARADHDLAVSLVRTYLRSL